ncbi:hypothetical protein [Ralstonia syzygii]|uniref:Uncharacterized protein n=1 Tax=Ralstonia syzygii R24 TaxID=907261 RepID=G3A9U1_9RALS|nr:hypothetical protein [Ralstonia syzygii]CCA88062.1 hypothetical protein RALSY_mp10601 [Ralstonia syzygii R24]
MPIRNALAKGIDPETGEILSDRSPFNQVTVIRALQPAPEKPTSKDWPRNAGQAWSEEEDQQLLNEGWPGFVKFPPRLAWGLFADL